MNSSCTAETELSLWTWRATADDADLMPRSATFWNLCTSSMLPGGQWTYGKYKLASVELIAH